MQRDIVIGLLIAGALAAWVPERFWQSFFLIDHPFWAKVWGPLMGPHRGHLDLRALHRERAAGRSPVERRHQLQWRQSRSSSRT